MSFIQEYLNHVDERCDHETKTIAETMVSTFRMNALQNSHNENIFNVFNGLTDEQMEHVPNFIYTMFPEREMRVLETSTPAITQLICKYQRTLADWREYRAQGNPKSLEDAILTMCNTGDKICKLRCRLMHQFILKHVGMLEYLLETYYGLETPITILLFRATAEDGVSFKGLYRVVCRELNLRVYDNSECDETKLNALFWIVYGAEMVYLYNLENCRMRDYSEEIVETESRIYHELFPEQFDEFIEHLELLDNAFETMSDVTDDPLGDFAKRMGFTNPLYFTRYADMLASKRFQHRMA